MKEFIQAPLPFQGQKRNFLKQFKECLNEFKDKTTFIDLFGGSGLLAHIIKQQRPDARVIFNDYDWFVTRLEHIGDTNALIKEIREVCIGLKKRSRVTGERIQKVIDIITKYEKQGYVDYITLSSSLLFSGSYATDYEDMMKEQFYYRVRMSDYDATGYLQGVEVEHLDYKILFNIYKRLPNVCFVLDPPYLSTDCSSYNKSNYWRLTDYLDVLLTLQDTSYFYFTSNKSSIVELCQWLAMHSNLEKPLKDAERREVVSLVNNRAKYRDIMFYRNRTY